MSQELTENVSAFGYELIRDHILSSILGKNEEDILYWAGKELARKFPATTLDEVLQFFTDASWGTLTLDKQSKEEAFFTLSGEEDLLHIAHRCFRLEAGFLAEQHQIISGLLTECLDDKNEKKQHVTFHVKWDVKDPIER